MTFDASVAVILIISVLLCVPPFLMLKLCARFYRRALRHRIETKRYLVAILAALAAFAYNVWALTSIAYRISNGAALDSPWHAVAVAIAWVTFWVWLFLAFGLGRDIAQRRGPK